MEIIHLAGAEDVKNASYTMRSAAEDMKQAASNIDHSLMLHQRFLDDWLVRFNDIIEKLLKKE
jgi:hypothetical protein